MRVVAWGVHGESTLLVFGPVGLVVSGGGVHVINFCP